MVDLARLVRVHGYYNNGGVNHDHSGSGGGCVAVYAYYGGTIIRHLRPPQTYPAGSYNDPSVVAEMLLIPILIGESEQDAMLRVIFAQNSYPAEYGYLAFGELLESAYLTHPKSAGRTLPSSAVLDQAVFVGPGGSDYDWSGSSITISPAFGTTPFPDYPGVLTDPQLSFPEAGSAHGANTSTGIGTFVFDTNTGLWDARPGIVSLSDLNTEFGGMYTLCGGSVSSVISFIQD